MNIMRKLSRSITEWKNLVLVGWFLTDCYLAITYPETMIIANLVLSASSLLLIIAANLYYRYDKVVVENDRQQGEK